MAGQTAQAPTAIKLAVGLASGQTANQWPVRPPEGRSDRSTKEQAKTRKHLLWKNLTGSHDPEVRSIRPTHAGQTAPTKTRKTHSLEKADRVT